jgi:hypothetical protein
MPMSKIGQLAANIEEYHKQHLADGSVEAFHFASRLWLFTGDKWARNYLDRNARKMVSGDDEQRKTIIRKKLANPRAVNSTKPYRRTSFKKYPKLAAYNAILFHTLMAETLYGKDLKPLVRQFISDEELIDTFRLLQTDSRSLRLLSTHAINFLWAVKRYFADEPAQARRMRLNPTKLLKLLPGYARLVENKIITADQSLKLQINLLTHAIIGESDFYVREVHDESYKKLCVAIERLIEANYFDVTLDNKLEFLVCAKLCSYRSRLAGVIEQESLNSLSHRGDYLVDTLNSHVKKTGTNLKRAEHRNTLFIMSQSDWRFAATKSTSRRKLTIGSFEKISFPDFGLMDVISKIDTGATSGSIHATDIKEVKLTTGKRALKFKPFDREPGVTVYRFSRKLIRSSNGQTAMRYIIPTTVVIQGVQYPINISLADRSLMKKDVLIGRKFLRSHGFVVDVNKGTKYRGLGRQI